jgi:hypothetical protein
MTGVTPDPRIPIEGNSDVTTDVLDECSVVSEHGYVTLVGPLEEWVDRRRSRAGDTARSSSGK